MSRPKSAHFTISLPGSEASSRAPSPAPEPAIETKNEYHDLTSKYTLDDDVTPGRQGADVYETNLSWWRAGLRRKLVKTVQWESVVIAKMQDKIRTPWLDAYFVYSSTLGTHTFFMTILPALFFFGYPELGRGLLTILGLGIYGSSVIKDLFCSPRPFAPPVTRLTIGSHHLEYGFPSTHSTNSVSIALFFFAQVHHYASIPISLSDVTPVSEPLISYGLYLVLCTILFIYAFSVVFGRLYTAMHSFTDCLMGIFLGAGIWWWHTDWAGIPVFIASSSPLHSLFTSLGLGALHPSGSLLLYLGGGLNAGAWIERWVQFGGWEVPFILIPLTLFAVHVHPQPVDDCPCFEDAIAILSVVLGALVSRWVIAFNGLVLPYPVVMPGSGWVREAGAWVQTERGMSDVLLWWTMAMVKFGSGIIVIFAWRLFAKSALHLVLPPTFRLLARAVRLPHRRFYTPATQYTSVPSEFHSPGADGGFALHTIPSVIDLPRSAGVGVEVGGIGSGVRGAQYEFKDADLKNRAGNGNGKSGYANGITTANGNGAPNGRENDKERAGKDGASSGVRHYDADVLTKVIVYAGIAVLATEVLPLTFDFVGWGVRSWVPV